MTASTSVKLADEFFGWQCRIRQHAVRKQEGRPPPGIQADVTLDGELAGTISTMINKVEAREVVAEFRFMLQKTEDPRAVYDNALKYLCEYYYQYPESFDRRLTALFGLDSPLARKIVDAGRCELKFSQGNQEYNFKCRAELCDQDSDLYQATYWHNHLFNSNMPGIVKVIGFQICGLSEAD